MKPTSTYRLQITPDFTLQDAAGVVDYLDELGVGALYLSPILASTTGSGHGYDVTDPAVIDPQRGGEQGWRELVAAARAKGLGIVVDIVPNHLGIAHAWENPAWWSTLRDGQSSSQARWFDVDWAAGPISVPVLGSADDVDRLTLSDDLTELSFYEHRFPVAPGTAHAGDTPRQVHDRQHYRLVPGAEGNEQLTYRRFFAVATLAGVRIEDEEVFRATHERIVRMVSEDGIDGLRVDHPDGLVDPKQYFERLAEACPDAWIVAEKILEHGEDLPDWPVAGTTGYDAMTEVNQVFVDPAAEDFFTDDYQRRTGDELDVAQHILRGKQWMAREMFGAETRRLLSLLDLGGLAPEQVAEAMHQLAARMGVYRTYLPDDDAALTASLADTRHDRTDLSAALDVLEPQLLDVGQEAARRFQQFTGAVMAKGVEDTAWYRANRFVALNEVGGHPASFGTDPDAFHKAMDRRERELPDSMTSLATHDTKRGEDVRARLAALSELRKPWIAFLDAFSADTAVPEPTFAHLLAQTLAGTGPVEDRQRLHDYAEKAMREAGLATSWMSPDAAFEQAVHDAIESAYESASIRPRWDALTAALDGPARSNSLAQKAVQLTMPGIPDVYQGTEVWDDSLVDPDNRRPVDHQRLRALLTSEPADAQDPAAKQHLVRTVLRLRRERPELFVGYRPVRATGLASDHLLGFERSGLISLATRLPVGLAEQGGWQDTTVDLDGQWTDQLTGAVFTGSILVSELLASYPVVLLTRG
ncbi:MULTISPECIES: malto-oligosyltrehalose synthase [unclassified Luteococcus]|uniref:malto-oligosyltrehalose synthase n=1 Tax=unclassified Luteococcus TaxID=2639923 RepID=UPI00313AE896